MINKFTYDIGKALNSSIGKYENLLIIGVMNSEVTQSSLHEFCNSYNLHSLCHKSTCDKNPQKFIIHCSFFFLGHSRTLKQ